MATWPTVLENSHVVTIFSPRLAFHLMKSVFFLVYPLLTLQETLHDFVAKYLRFEGFNALMNITACNLADFLITNLYLRWLFLMPACGLAYNFGLTVTLPLLQWFASLPIIMHICA